MPVTLADAPPADRIRPPRSRPARRRAAWRQSLVEAERGLTAGFRSDSVFFVHLFCGSLAVAAGVLLGLSASQWALLILAVTIAISAELFHQVLKRLDPIVVRAAPETASAIRRLGVAAVTVTTFGAATAVTVLLGSRLWMLFRH